MRTGKDGRTRLVGAHDGLAVMACRAYFASMIATPAARSHGI
jgi:hypothetical protein